MGSETANQLPDIGRDTVHFSKHVPIHVSAVNCTVTSHTQNSKCRDTKNIDHWCTGKTWREWVEREVGGGIGMGNTCKPLAVSFQCMTKSTTNKKKKKTVIISCPFALWTGPSWVTLRLL